MAQGGTKYSCLISIHALLAESDGESVVKIVEQWAFLSTLSLRRATSYPGLQSARLQNFYPRSPCGERLSTAIVTQHPRDFYPRSPCGERPAIKASYVPLDLFLSTLSLRRATQQRGCFTSQLLISIHALLAESDLVKHNVQLAQLFLSTLSLRRATFSSSFRAGICRFLSTLSLRRATRSLKRPFGTMHRFLSTLSLRRATICGACCSAIIRNFYPRSPCGERLEMARAQFAISEISIHALLAESDLVVIIFWCSTMQFLSTLSLRRATTAIHVIQGGVDISIHALLAESDFFPQGFLFLCGISIHALLAESDPRFRCI